jgi:hypothetical protein
MRDVERNALRANLCETAEVWRWGSLWRRTNNVRSPLLSDWPLPEPRNWTKQVNTPQTGGVALNAVNPFCNRNSHRILRPIEKMGGFGRNEIWETCGNGPPTGLTALGGTGILPVCSSRRWEFESATLSAMVVAKSSVRSTNQQFCWRAWPC